MTCLKIRDSLHNLQPSEVFVVEQGAMVGPYAAYFNFGGTVKVTNMFDERISRFWNRKSYTICALEFLRVEHLSSQFYGASLSLSTSIGM